LSARTNTTVCLIEPSDGPSVCGPILRSVPEWFGIEQATLKYIAETATLPTWVAWRGDKAVGFVSVYKHEPKSAEMHCIAVLKEAHGTGVGTALVRHIEVELRAQGIEYLQVKTQGPSLPCEEYARTTHFYESIGYVRIEELHGIWPGMPALLLIKKI
jgi:ribosomal protein S18 acetylase RimI-like enzyme